MPETIRNFWTLPDNPDNTTNYRRTGKRKIFSVALSHCFIENKRNLAVYIFKNSRYFHKIPDISEKPAKPETHRNLPDTTANYRKTGKSESHFCRTVALIFNK